MVPSNDKESVSVSKNGKTAESSKDLSTNTKSQRPKINEDDLYRNTTQYRFWSFTEESLSKKRAKVNQKGKNTVVVHIKRLVDQQSSSSNNDPSESTESAPSFTPLFNYTFEQACSLVEIVTPDEELKEVNYYVSVLNKLCKSVLKLPIQARYTAISFFKKFYLSNSVMQIHPKQVLTTCIFLACKSENCFISPNTLSDLIGAKKRNNANNSSGRDAILSLEFPLLTSLKFSLMCHHPHSPLQGFLYDFQTVLIHKNKQGVVVIRSDKHGNKRKVRVKYTKQRMLDCFKSAMNMVENLMQSSDLMFFYTPSQIALACLFLADEELTDSYLIYKFGTSNSDASNTAAKGDRKKENNNSKDKENKNEVSNSESKDAGNNSENKDVDSSLESKDAENGSEKKNSEVKIEKNETTAEQQFGKDSQSSVTEDSKDDLAEKTSNELQRENGKTKGSGTGNDGPAKSLREENNKILLKILKKCIKDMQEKCHEIPDISVAKLIDKKVHYCIHPDKLLKRKMQDDELNHSKRAKIE